MIFNRGINKAKPIILEEVAAAAAAEGAPGADPAN